MGRNVRGQSAFIHSPGGYINVLCNMAGWDGSGGATSVVTTIK